MALLDRKILLKKKNRDWKQRRNRGKFLNVLQKCEPTFQSLSFTSSLIVNDALKVKIVDNKVRKIKHFVIDGSENDADAIAELKALLLGQILDIVEDEFQNISPDDENSKKEMDQTDEVADRFYNKMGLHSDVRGKFGYVLGQLYTLKGTNN